MGHTEDSGSGQDGVPARGQPSTGESKVVQVSGRRGGHITVQDRQAPEGHGGPETRRPRCLVRRHLTEAKGPACT